MKVLAIIEKGTDGLYSIRTEQSIGNFIPGGFGESVEIAKEDFSECVDQALEDSTLTKEDIEIEYRYDLPSFFNYFDYFNISKLAKFVGINESQMRQYKNGLAFPCEKTIKKIMDGVHTIGKELYASSL